MTTSAPSSWATVRPLAPVPADETPAERTTPLTAVSLTMSLDEARELLAAVAAADAEPLVVLRACLSHVLAVGL